MNQQQQTDFGFYLKDLRKHRGLKQKQVARELGLKPECLSMIESGRRRAPDELLIQLAKKYRVPLEELLRRKYWPQLLLLTGIINPTELVTDLRKDLHPEEVEEVTRYIAFLLLRRAAASRS